MLARLNQATRQQQQNGPINGPTFVINDAPVHDNVSRKQGQAEAKAEAETAPPRKARNSKRILDRVLAAADSSSLSFSLSSLSITIMLMSEVSPRLDSMIGNKDLPDGDYGSRSRVLASKQRSSQAIILVAFRPSH